MMLEGIVYRYVLKVPGEECGLCYVGETTDPHQRYQNWRKPNGKYYAGGKIGDARVKYGTGDDIWDYEVLETLQSTDKASLRQLLEEREAFYIAKYDSVAKGFNTSAGGTGNKGVNFNPEWRAKIGNASRGRRHTEETKKRISQKMQGHSVSKEVREKISAGNKGKERTQEQRQAQSLRMKGKVMSDAARAKSSAKKKGKPHPISAEGMANINAHRYKISIWAIDRTGNQMEFNSLSEAAVHFNVSVAAVSHLLRTGNYGTHGYKFKKKNTHEKEKI
jgi:group I intron endonuclease